MDIELYHRNTSAKAIYDILINDEKFKTLNDEFIVDISFKMETSCQNACIDKALNRNIPIFWDSMFFVEQYSNILYTLMSNMDTGSDINDNNCVDDRYVVDRLYGHCVISKLFKNAIYNVDRLCETLNLIDVNKIGYYNSEKLNPYINSSYIDNIKIREKQKINEKTSIMYKCPQCKMRNTKFRKIQTASMDEGDTLFITCQVCHYEWRCYG